MIIIDTNVLVRFLTNDEPIQARRARALIENGAAPIMLAKTVLLETEWVLRRAYGFGAERIMEGLSALLRLPNVTCEDLQGVRTAIAWTIEFGLDFADALHLSLAESHRGSFATFDERLVKRSSRAAGVMAQLV